MTEVFYQAAVELHAQNVLVNGVKTMTDTVGMMLTRGYRELKGEMKEVVTPLKAVEKEPGE